MSRIVSSAISNNEKLTVCLPLTRELNESAQNIDKKSRKIISKFTI